MRIYLFAFETDQAARIFVQRVAKYLNHVAMLIDGNHVHLVDGAEEAQHMEIIRLARSSSAQQVARSPAGRTRIE